MRYGFNALWMFASRGQQPDEPDMKMLDFMAVHGLNYIRFPTDYRFWTEGTNYAEPDEGVLTILDGYVEAARSRGLHVSLNLHRGPGYCINYNNLETYNLWVDREAQDGFVAIWTNFARRYSAIPASDLSFDLINEPPAVGQYQMTRGAHESIMRRAIEAIREVSPTRPITVDGLASGNIPMPELVDAGVTQSCRGYTPFPISHHKAAWADTEGLPDPVWPGLEWNGTRWDKEALRRHYRPWLEVESAGSPIHVGEFGCFNKTDDTVAMAWLRDLLSLYKEYRWGYAMWNFKGPFGVVEHGRPGSRYEIYKGYRIDRELFELFLSCRCSTT
jgi:endoglucanase